MASKGTKGKKGTQRKLTPIFSADVVGYSRLIEFQLDYGAPSFRIS